MAAAPASSASHDHAQPTVNESTPKAANATSQIVAV